MTAMVVAAGVGGLAAAWMMGPLFFVLLLFMSMLGLVYNLEIESPGEGTRRIFVLKRIPGSKTVLVTLAWGIAAALVPALDGYGYFAASSVAAFAWVSALVFVRTSFFDIIDMQGSRIAGRETIPIILGEHRTMRLLKIILAATVLFLPVCSAAGLLPYAASVLSLCPAAMFAFLHIYERTSRFLGILRGFFMESIFILAGILALVCAWGF